MNNVCLCIGEYAKTPFLFKNSEINIYSMEELCYYFMENLQTLDQEIVTLELTDWIKKECRLVELAEELETYVRKNVSVVSFVTVLFEKTAIYTQPMIKQAERILKEQAALSPFERWKKKADRLYQSGKFHQAQSIYSRLLDEVPQEDTLLRANLYYNIGSIYAMNFDYMEAAEHFKEAYQMEPVERTKLAYILAMKQALNDFDYGVFQRSHEDWHNDFVHAESMFETAKGEWKKSKAYGLVNRINELKELGQIQEYEKMRDDLIYELKRDYRKQTL